MNMFYVVLEITSEEVTSTLCTDISEAYRIYFNIMSTAYNSDDIYHGATILQYNGTHQSIIEGRILDRSAQTFSQIIESSLDE